MKTANFITAGIVTIGFLLVSVAARPTAISQTPVDDFISYLQTCAVSIPAPGERIVNFFYTKVRFGTYIYIHAHQLMHMSIIYTYIIN